MNQRPSIAPTYDLIVAIEAATYNLPNDVPRCLSVIRKVKNLFEFNCLEMFSIFERQFPNTRSARP